jgi:hypothetical protein
MEDQEQILLTDFDVSFPPVSALPKPQGPYVIVRLIQRQQYDRENMCYIEDQFQPIKYSSKFSQTVQFKSLTLVRSSWVQGEASPTATKKFREQTVSIQDYSREAIQSLIDENDLYLYVNALDESESPKTVGEYKKMFAPKTVASQTTNGAPTPTADPIATELPS